MTRFDAGETVLRVDRLLENRLWLVTVPND